MRETKVVTVNLDEAVQKLRGKLRMTPEELARFDAASNHPYECRCAICQEWWTHMGPEDAPEDEA